MYLFVILNGLMMCLLCFLPHAFLSFQQFLVSHVSHLLDVFYSFRLLLAFSMRLLMRYIFQHAALNCIKPSALASLSDSTAHSVHLKYHLV